MKNEKTIKLDFTRHLVKVENRTSKEVRRMKKPLLMASLILQYTIRNGFLDLSHWKRISSSIREIVNRKKAIYCHDICRGNIIIFENYVNNISLTIFSPPGLLV